MYFSFSLLLSHNDLQHKVLFGAYSITQLRENKKIVRSFYVFASMAKFLKQKTITQNGTKCIAKKQ